MPTAALPVVLVRVPPPGGKGRHKLTKREAAGGLFFGLADRYGDAAFAAYRNAVGELRFVAEPSKGQVGDGPAAARAVAACAATASAQPFSATRAGARVSSRGVGVRHPPPSTRASLASGARPAGPVCRACRAPGRTSALTIYPRIAAPASSSMGG